MIQASLWGLRMFSPFKLGLFRQVAAECSALQHPTTLRSATRRSATPHSALERFHQRRGRLDRRFRCAPKFFSDSEVFRKFSGGCGG